jgi:GTP-binding protein
MTLYDLRLKHLYAAQNGQPGSGRNKHGRSGSDLVLDVPAGTKVFVHKGESGEEFLADLTDQGQQVCVAEGGRGGKGNTHFKSSTMRTPRFAQPGEEGEELRLRLELNLLAEVGLIGLPNAGKSTFLTRVSAARPEVAAYPFTTLVPKLGVVKDELGRQLVMADIPGLIQGAHAGQGLGTTFLRHVSRTRLLVHLLSVEDITLEEPWAGFGLINEELHKFDPDLAAREQIWAVNKIDLWPEDKVAELKSLAVRDGVLVFCLSTLHNWGVDDVMQEVWGRVRS